MAATATSADSRQLKVFVEPSAKCPCKLSNVASVINTLRLTSSICREGTLRLRATVLIKRGTPLFSFLPSGLLHIKFQVEPRGTCLMKLYLTISYPSRSLKYHQLIYAVHLSRSKETNRAPKRSPRGNMWLSSSRSFQQGLCRRHRRGGVLSISFKLSRYSISSRTLAEDTSELATVPLLIPRRAESRHGATTNS